MKQFLAIFTGSPEAMNKWKAMDPATQKTKGDLGKKEWMNWAEKNHKSIVMQGGPLGVTKRVEASGISDIRNKMGAFVVVQADSHEAAAKMFTNHPHFSIFPGDGVEVMEVMPIPM
jgi:hypothetical protein